MSRQRRIEEKRRRRQKRDQKRSSARGGVEPRGGDAVAELAQLNQLISGLVKIPPPADWPGAADPALSRPDRVKFEFANAVLHESRTGAAKYRRFKTDVARGLLGWVPDIEGWAMEEFLWHGAPADDWHPIDAYLEQAGHRLPPPAREQLRLWKEARIGLFEVGDVLGSTLTLREWDVRSDAPAGPHFPAIALNIGGVNAYRGQRGQFTITYVAPWAPAEGLWCAMGFGMTAPRAKAAGLAPLLAFRTPAAVAQPLPWNENPRAERRWLAEWRQREWIGWLRERLSFPFEAVVQTISGVPERETIVGLLEFSAEESRRYGVYLLVPDAGELALVGATGVMPLDVPSQNMDCLSEYHAYRKLAGPPEPLPLDRRPPEMTPGDRQFR